MKIRTDFVTNSSSSSFILTIGINLANGESIRFEGVSGCDGCRVNYFEDEVVVNVSPKELGTAESIDKLIELLQEGVTDGDLNLLEEFGVESEELEERKIFKKSHPLKVFDKTIDAYNFIKEIRDKVKDMSQIEKITISGNEENYLSYYRTYAYNLKTKKYAGLEEGSVFEKDGSSGGDLFFSDLKSCKKFNDEFEFSEYID